MNDSCHKHCKSFTYLQLEANTEISAMVTQKLTMTKLTQVLVDKEKHTRQD